MTLELDPQTGYLADGDHGALLEEVESFFGFTYRRRQILVGLRWVVGALRSHGVLNIWLDGSFVTAKLRPRDVDVAYDPPAGVNTDSWGLLAFGRRLDLKKAQRVDLWPHPSPQPSKGLFGLQPIREWWRTDANGTAKGLVKLMEEE